MEKNKFCHVLWKMPLCVYMYVGVFHFTIFFHDTVLLLIVPPHVLKEAHFTQVYDLNGFQNGKSLLIYHLVFFEMFNFSH